MSMAHLTIEKGKVTRRVADLCQGGRVRVAYDDKGILPVNSGTNQAGSR